MIKYEYNDLIRISKNLKRNISDDLNNFIIYYNKIILNDEKSPLYKKNEKYNLKFSKNTKNTKNNSYILVRNSDAWDPFSYKNNNEILRNNIRNILNKLSSDNYNQIIIDLDNFFKTSFSFNVLIIMGEEIFEKIIFDTDYHNQYINMSKYIFDLNNYYEKIINIIEYNKEFYWYIDNFISTNQVIGPFNNKDILYKSAKNNINFKNILLNKLFNEFSNRHNYLYKSNKSDEDNFKSKRRIIGLVEFTTKLILESTLNNDLINKIINNLVYCSNIEKEYLEAIHKIINIMNDKNINIFSNEELIKLKKTIKLLDNDKWSTREYFMIDFITDNLNNISYFTNNIKIDKDYNEDIETKINKLLKNKLFDKLYSYCIDNRDNILEIINLIISISLIQLLNYDYNKLSDFITKLYIDNIINIDYLYDIYYYLIENIEELKLDNKNIKINIYNLYNYFNKKIKDFNLILK